MYDPVAAATKKQLREKENELKNLKRIYAQFRKEKESISKIKRQQEKVLQGFRYNEEEEERKNSLNEELRQIKLENKN